MEQFTALMTASLLTLFDLDRTFYVPNKTGEKTKLYLWWWGFVVVNGLLAVALSIGFANFGLLPEIEQGWLRGIAVGIGFLAIIRLKVTTFNVRGDEIPFGLELLYEGVKAYVYKRINRIALESRYEEAVRLASETELKELGIRAKLRVDQDALLSDDERKRTKTWLLKVLEDEDSTEREKQLSLADFVLSGQFRD